MPAVRANARVFGLVPGQIATVPEDALHRGAIRNGLLTEIPTDSPAVAEAVAAVQALAETPEDELFADWVDSEAEEPSEASEPASEGEDTDDEDSEPVEASGDA